MIQLRADLEPTESRGVSTKSARGVLVERIKRRTEAAREQRGEPADSTVQWEQWRRAAFHEGHRQTRGRADSQERPHHLVSHRLWRRQMASCQITVHSLTRCWNGISVVFILFILIMQVSFPFCPIRPMIKGHYFGFCLCIFKWHCNKTIQGNAGHP